MKEILKRFCDNPRDYIGKADEIVTRLWTDSEYFSQYSEEILCGVVGAIIVLIIYKILF